MNGSRCSSESPRRYGNSWRLVKAKARTPRGWYHNSDVDTRWRDSTDKGSMASDAIKLGIEAYQRGQLEQASLHCRRALLENPKHSDANYLLGVIAIHQARWT